MTQENMIELEIALRNIEQTLWEDMAMFRVYRRVREAREQTGKLLRGEG